jgi:hypothetical protein
MSIAKQKKKTKKSLLKDLISNFLNEPGELKNAAWVIKGKQIAQSG